MRNIFFIVIVLFTVSCHTIKKNVATKSEEIISITTDSVVIKPKNNIYLNYQKTPEKIIDILHTDLKVKFDFKKHLLFGETDITITPYIQSISSFYLDAKMMAFKKVALLDENNINIPITYTYDSAIIQFNSKEPLLFNHTYHVNIHYTANPDKCENRSGKAIKDEKGLYFINTNGDEPFKPMQVWTQGETESNSCWFPTTDKPFEKCTFKLSITVPDTLQTLSNGTLLPNSVMAEDENLHFRTDIWVQDKPMSPYLVMMAIGKYGIESDSWKDKKVNYYVDTNYKQVAKNIFNHTPEMIEYYSNILSTPYPWDKYSQVIAHDYVSGAMENTSATLHGLFVQKNERQLLDSKNDGIVAHELFHQWFGDLVTCESWAHLTLNEGFASFGEQLWDEYKYGNDEGLKTAYQSMKTYLNYAKNVNDPAIINFQYEEPDDMFSSITYKKGARVLNLLRFEVGDSLFYLALKNYLHTYQYQSAQIDDLRRIFEKTTGKDLRPFFEQWFFKPGHPDISVLYSEKDSLSQMKITIIQTQDSELGIYHFPLQIKIKTTNDEIIETYQIKKKKTEIIIPLVNRENDEISYFIDPNSLFIGNIKDSQTNKQLWLLKQRASTYIEKIRLLEKCEKLQNENDTSRQILFSFINDENNNIQLNALQSIIWDSTSTIKTNKDNLIKIISESENTAVKAEAIKILDSLKDNKLFPLFLNHCANQSYKVSAAALNATATLLPNEALHQSDLLKGDMKDNLLSAISSVYSQYGDSNSSNFFPDNVLKYFGYQRAELIKKYKKYVIRLKQKNIQQHFLEVANHILKIDDDEYVAYTCYLSFLQLADELKKDTETTEEGNVLFAETIARIRSKKNKKITIWLKESGYDIATLQK